MEKCETFKDFGYIYIVKKNRDNKILKEERRGRK